MELPFRSAIQAVSASCIFYAGTLATISYSVSVFGGDGTCGSPFLYLAGHSGTPFYVSILYLGLWLYLEYTSLVDWWTYILAIGLFFLIHRKKRMNAVLLSLISITALFLLVETHPRQSLDITWGPGICRCMTEFTLGIVLYQIYLNQAVQQFIQKDISFYAASIAVLLLMHGHLHDVLLIPFFGWLIGSAAANEGSVSQFMSKPFMQFVGNISYSVYMMQGLWMNVFFIWMKYQVMTYAITDVALEVKLLMMTAMVAATILSACFTYKWVEVKGRKWLYTRLAKMFPTQKVRA